MSIKRACVIGWPVSHSRSPLIHGYWIKLYEIAGDYGRKAIPPDGIAEFLTNLSKQGYVGCNVTLPHKEAAFRAVRSADEATKRLGVVNTVFVSDGVAWGTNTDGEGFLGNLRAAVPSWSARDRRMVILGAGGAARAVIGALLDDKAGEIVIVNRSRDRAEDILHHFVGPLRVGEWSNAGKELAAADLLVNTTSLGMVGQPALELDLALLPTHAVVSDIVYAPLETSLIRRSRTRGNPVAAGLGMLLHQAVRGFELWFGVRPEVTSDLYDLVARDIEPPGTS